MPKRYVHVYFEPDGPAVEPERFIGTHDPSETESGGSARDLATIFDKFHRSDRWGRTARQRVTEAAIDVSRIVNVTIHLTDGIRQQPSGEVEGAGGVIALTNIAYEAPW